ncbi:TPMT family class I SAM-dependent methyltransferase [Gramella sp. AN32]|uniref:TPMT family class I SAM-dependent methyltransferase n=1 Tax=Christiangramia antarctica TaxID=2058158 RepID=A0ABW5X7X6_9FLAO|nr:TPMT family class I SAM-dependent methyltransferase [Gramella sp. AN32]MCM4157639.1 SAM-dependent methyltransferase [Gramella sp. AN32]
MKNKSFWEKRYKSGDTGWDIGQVSPPIQEYIYQLKNKEIKILIPGGGNSYETEYLFRNGFENVFLIDIAEKPLQNLKSRLPEFPDDQLIPGDFFDLDDDFDLILEQTFFCAIDPALRPDYARKSSELLKQQGKLAGVLFNTEFGKHGPPFGGNKEEYLMYFSPYYEILKFEECYNSIAPRAGRELFFIFGKK